MTNDAQQVITTKAYGILKPGADFELMTVKLNPLTQTQVQVKLEFCGLCHTDIHMQRNDWNASNYPLVPGHEGIGRVTKIGAQVSQLKIGDLVGIGWIRDSCKNCIKCLAGEDNLCREGYQGTYLSSKAGCWGKKDYSLQGCFSQLMHIEERFAFKIPSSIKPEEAAPLMCAGITVWEPIVKYVKPGSKVGVVSLGGLGHMAIKLIKIVGGSVCVFSSSDSKKNRALNELGANKFINTSKSEEMTSVASSLDVIIDTCPVALDLATYMATLAFGGVYIRVGVPISGSSLKYDYMPLIFSGKSIVGSIVSGSLNTKTMLELSDSHGIRSDVQVIEFKDINSACKDLLCGKNSAFRYVLKW